MWYLFRFQSSPERSTRTQQKEFQSYILDGVMEHLLAADVLLGQEFIHTTQLHAEARKLFGTHS